MLLASAAVVIAVAVGFGLGTYRASSARSVQLERDLSGTLTAVSGDGSKICFAPDDGTDIVCGVPVQVPGNPNLVVGDRVSATQAWVTSGDDRNEVLIVRDPVPVPVP